MVADGVRRPRRERRLAGREHRLAVGVDLGGERGGRVGEDVEREEGEDRREVEGPAERRDDPAEQVQVRVRQRREWPDQLLRRVREPRQDQPPDQDRVVQVPAREAGVADAPFRRTRSLPSAPSSPRPAKSGSPPRRRRSPRPPADPARACSGVRTGPRPLTDCPNDCPRRTRPSAAAAGTPFDASPSPTTIDPIRTDDRRGRGRAGAAGGRGGGGGLGPQARRGTHRKLKTPEVRTASAAESPGMIAASATFPGRPAPSPPPASPPRPAPPAAPPPPPRGRRLKARSAHALPCPGSPPCPPSTTILASRVARPRPRAAGATQRSPHGQFCPRAAGGRRRGCGDGDGGSGVLSLRNLLPCCLPGPHRAAT